MIRIENVSYQYPFSDRQVIRNITLEIQKGEHIAILGANGSGKSTLTRLLNGLLFPQTGSIQVDGLLTTNSKTIGDIRRKVQIVFQNPDNQIVGTTLEEDIRFGLSNIGFPIEEIESQVNHVLKLVGLEGQQRKSVHALSGGEKQKLALASVLALSPQYLILDEATAMLDPGSRRQFLQTIQQIRSDEQRSIVTVTHYFDEVVNVDRIVLLKEGQIERIAEPQQLIQHPEVLEACGVELPYLPAIAQQLRTIGIKVNPFPTIQELVDVLCR
ncbi:MAG: polyamine transporter ATPase [Bacilli bacterium]|nr:polyamine transporter ATPase [Bacilli bacterium]